MKKVLNDNQERIKNRLTVPKKIFAFGEGTTDGKKGFSNKYRVPDSYFSIILWIISQYYPLSFYFCRQKFFEIIYLITVVSSNNSRKYDLLTFYFQPLLDINARQVLMLALDALKI